jgi:uncharacterized protein YbdZ (MbtH family)
LWWPERPLPPGWHTAGFEGPEDQCLEWIEHVWPDPVGAGE